MALELVSSQAQLVKALARWIPRLSWLLDVQGTEDDLDDLIKQMTSAADMPKHIARAIVAKRNGK
jgi:hypothetical protein